MDAYRQDDVVAWWLDIRGQTIHDAPPDFRTAMHISSLNQTTLMEMQGNPPPGATSFVIGDELGGCCWVVRDEDGAETKVYVPLPPSVGQTWVNFDDPPSGRSLSDLAEELMATTAKLVDEANRWVAGHQ